MQCLLEDLNDLDGQQKGKQHAGKLGDLEVAINYMRDDIVRMQMSIQDEKLALSTATAVVVDQNMLASIANDEAIAEQDHRYALALSNEEATPHDTSAPGEKTFNEENKDTVSAVLSDLMSRVTVYDGPTNEQSSSLPIFASTTSNIGEECVSCLEKFHTTMFVPRLLQPCILL